MLLIIYDHSHSYSHSHSHEDEDELEKGEDKDNNLKRNKCVFPIQLSVLTVPSLTLFNKTITEDLCS